MKDIRAAVFVLCVLGALCCVPAAGQTSAEAPSMAAEDTVAIAAADSTGAAVPRYREAEPVLRMVERERPRLATGFEAPQRGMRILVDAFLLAMAIFTIFTFLGMRKSGEPEYREEPGIRRTHRKRRRAAVESSSLSPGSAPAERERPPQNPRERAERLKSRRDQLAAEIDRLMKRI